MMKEGVLHELSEGWVWTRLGDIIIRISNGITKRQTKDNIGSMVTRIETISNGTIDLNRVGYLKDLSSEEIEKYRLFPGDILFSHINSDLHLGKTAIFCSNSLTLLHGMNLLLIRPNEDLICPKILHHLCNHYRYAGSFISIAQHAVNQSSINQLNLRNISIPLPPLPEQRAIVSKIEQLFSDLDNGIENFKKARAQLKLYRQSVLKAACEGKLVPTEAALARAEGRDYEAADVLLARILKERREKWNGKGKYKEAAAPDTSRIPELPEGWKYTSLDQLLTLILAGKSFKCEERVPNQDEIVVVKVSAVTWGEFDESESKTCMDSERINENFLIRKWDFLFSRANTIELVGACVIVKQINKELMLSDKILRFDFAVVPPQWILINLRTGFGRSEIERLATGNQESMRNIGQDRIREIRIPLPPLAEQRRIVAEVERRLSLCDKMEATITESLQKAETLRQSILKKAFEGKLLNKKELEKARNAPDWEPAEKLLQRIKTEKMNIKTTKKNKK